MHHKKRSKLKPSKRSVLHKITGLEWSDDEDKIAPVRGDRALWRAVILQALEDAASQSKKVSEQYYKTEAIHWLEGRSEDFVTVCDLAGFAYKDVRAAAKRALLNGCKWRLPAGTGIKAQKKKRGSALPSFETKALRTA
jgi:hypothetical protein